MYEMTLNLDEKQKETLYEQIYMHIRDEIQQGKIRCGERLPSTRRLAAQLAVSRSTAQMAYEQLLSEGYIEAVPCKGYFVCQIEELYHFGQNVHIQAETKIEEKKSCRYDFTLQGVDLEHFPYATWRKLYREVLQNEQEKLFHLGDAKGEEEFRAAICDYLHQARGVNAHPSQIVIGAGSDYLLMLLSRMLGIGYKVAMESPTYRHAYDIFRHLGYGCCTVSMDKYGMDVEALGDSGADIAYVMPSHQYPTGIVMPVKRRQELLSWAAGKPGRYIIEDDYDSEFRYIGKPIPSLQGSDGRQRVIYTGTFSKALAPGIRISYLVLPLHLLGRYEQVGRNFPCTVSRVDQRILQLFMERGHFERHLNRMRALYKSKRDVLLAQVKQIKCVRQILGERFGVHILLRLDDKMTGQERIEKAEEAGVRVYPLSGCCINQKTDAQMVLLGYATLKEEEIRTAAGILRAVWDEEA